MRNRIVPADFETPVLTKRYARTLAVARALDDKAALPPARRPADHDFESFLNVMTPQRLRLLKLLMRHEWLLGELAEAVERDRSAVRRDVSALARCHVGLTPMSISMQQELGEEAGVLAGDAGDEGRFGHEFASVGWAEGMLHHDRCRT